MPLLSKEEVLGRKLNCIPREQLIVLAHSLSLSGRGSVAKITKELIESNPNEEYVDNFIKDEYAKLIELRRARISDENLRQELKKVDNFSWGVVQGRLDSKIQQQYVRRIVTYDNLVSRVAAGLHDEITDYVVCTWFNHWTTQLIEEHISAHKCVIPTLKNVKGVDLFFAGQPFDLKTTYLPKDYDPTAALKNPSDLAIWMYENQGAERFGSDNRLFVILFDKENPSLSWQLKRDFDLVFDSIDDFFDTEKVSSDDEIEFYFNEKLYHPISKVLLITK